MNGGRRENTQRLLKALRKRIGSGEKGLDSWMELTDELDTSTRIDVVATMVSQDFWYWLSLISEILKEGEKEGYLLGLLKALGEKINPELASQIYWNSLVGIGVEQSESSKEYVEALLSEGKRMHSIFASMLMAGVHRTDPGWSMEKIADMMNSDRTNEVYCAMGAARIVLKEDEGNLNRLASIILDIEVPDDPDIQSIYSMCIRLIHPVDPEGVENRFLELHEKAPEWVRNQIAYDVSVIPDFSEDVLKNILD